MDSWSYVSEEKDLLFSNGTLSYSRSKNSNLDWDLKTPSTFATDMSASGQQNIENHGFQELGFPEMSGKQVSEGKIISPVMAAGDDSNSNLSISVVEFESKGRDSLIDLKLGRLADHRDGHDSSFSKNAPIVSSSVPAKRIRPSKVRTAYCQVCGCNKDLSASKDYHKRHRVCEVHSKTAKVIVNGIEQRFCQQCSRFHLLAEFDDGKRSCRKRLAGHNERRRKPQMGILSRKSGRLLQPFSDSRFLGTMLSTTSSFICEDIFPSKDLLSEKYGTNDWWRPTKMEDGSHHYKNLSGLPVTNGHVQSSSSSPFPSYNPQKQVPFVHDNDPTNPAARSLFSDYNNSQYPPPLFQDINLGIEDLNVFNTASTFQGLSGILDSGSGRALSLLSSQSQNSSSYSSGVPMATRPIVVPGSHCHYSCNSQVSEITGISSQSYASGVSENFPILISDSNDIGNFEMTDGIFQGWDFLNTKNSLSCGDGRTVDLLQLSSQLQRVEHHRQSLQVKQENDCSPQIT